MKPGFTFLFCLSLLFCGCQAKQSETRPAAAKTQRERDGLRGPARAVLTEDAVHLEQTGAALETQLVSSLAIYEDNGAKKEETPFRLVLVDGFAEVPHEAGYNTTVAGGVAEEAVMLEGKAAGRWVSRYDARGLLQEKTRFDAAGTITQRSQYQYEFDARGNWTRRTSHLLDRQNEMPRLFETSRRLILYDDDKGAARSDTPASAALVSVDQNNPLPDNPENREAGHLLYQQRCAVCHGDDGKGQTSIAAFLHGRPANLAAAGALTDGRIFMVMRDGIPGARMPGQAGRISVESMWRIALYVRQLSRAPGLQAVGTSPAAAAAMKNKVAGADRRFDFAGKIVSVDRERGEVMVDHEAVQEYMGAMTMSFPLKDKKGLAGLQAGDQIRAVLVVREAGGWWLEKVAKE
ncbi:MAG: copper-binding protein [Blastocatellia bacterium]